MHRGTGKHPVTPGAVVNIRTDAEFTVYAITKGVRSSIIGPNHASERHFKFNVPLHTHQIEITTRKSGRWVLTETVNPSPKEHLDKTPVELGVKDEVDPHADMIRDITERVLSQVAAKQGHETLEESDDFDVEDEYDPTSPYELQEMQEEIPLEQPPTKKEEPPASCPAASVGDSEPPVPAEQPPAAPPAPSAG